MRLLWSKLFSLQIILLSVKETLNKKKVFSSFCRPFLPRNWPAWRPASSLTPIVLSTTGGASPEADKHHKRIAQLIALKKKEEYSHTINYIRTRLRFNLLRSILVALRGERGRRTKFGSISAIEYGMIPTSIDWVANNGGSDVGGTDVGGTDAVGNLRVNWVNGV